MSLINKERRSFLRAAGVCVALPALESLPLGLSSLGSSSRASAAEQAGSPRRMICIGNEFGMFPGAFWPKTLGAKYETTALLKPLQSHRKDYTLFSHLDHGLKGGHFAVHTFLTGVNSSDARGAPDDGMSLDQRAAEFVGSRTRFPSLTIGSDNGLHGGCQMCWTRTGTRIPPIQGPRELFRSLFVEDDAKAKRLAEDRIRLQGSILDAVHGDAQSLKRKLNKSDGAKLDEYFSSIRDVEAKLALDRQWQRIAKPKSSLREPANLGLARDLPKIYDLIALALQTDSTRVATLEIGGSFVARDLGISKGYHGLSHHGHLPANLELLVQIELYQVEQFARFLEKLRSIREPQSDASLLDSSTVLFGSGMGNGNAHTNHDLPIILAGGGFRHGEHKSFPSAKRQRVPLSNLFVSMLQRFGVETDRFSASSGTLTGLKTA